MLTIISSIFIDYLGTGNQLAILGAMGVILAALLLIAWLVNGISKLVIRQALRHVKLPSSSLLLKEMVRCDCFSRLAPLLGASLFYQGLRLLNTPVFSWSETVISVGQSMAMLYILWTSLLFISICMNVAYLWYNSNHNTHNRPISGYIQAIKIVLWGMGIILAISIIFQKSPLTLLAGIGAVSALLMFVFKDTITGLVANVQVTANDMIRVGDWVTVPSYNADGSIVDLSVNTTKIRNFDNTIVTIPTFALISSGVTNWRGMFESGGRRIQRSITLDIDTIRFCDHDLAERLKHLDLMKDYIEQAQQDIDTYNARHEINTDIIANGRQLTNIGLLRTYISRYLQAHPKIHKDMFFIVRQLQPTSTGVPLEVYVFTTETAWASYEQIQSDLFDHLLAILPMFDLRAFQVLSSSAATT